MASPQVIRVIRDLEEHVEKESAELAARILTNVVLGTPVGNPTLWQNPAGAPPGYAGGHARLNWQVSIDAATDVELPGIDASGSTAIANGIATARTAKITNVVYIVNNVPYIGRLNDGHSTQAPVGFIDAAVTIGIQGG